MRSDTWLDGGVHGSAENYLLADARALKESVEIKHATMKIPEDNVLKIQDFVFNPVKTGGGVKSPPLALN